MPREPLIFNTGPNARSPEFAEAMARAEAEAGGDTALPRPETFASGLAWWAYEEAKAGRMTAARYRALLAEERG